MIYHFKSFIKILQETGLFYYIDVIFELQTQILCACKYCVLYIFIFDLNSKQGMQQYQISALTFSRKLLHKTSYIDLLTSLIKCVISTFSLRLRLWNQNLYLKILTSVLVSHIKINGLENLKSVTCITNVLQMPYMWALLYKSSSVPMH